MYDVFLSYNSRDREAVEKVALALKKRGLKPFLDRWYLGGGGPWISELEKLIAESRALAVFLGPHGIGRWQTREKDLALVRQADDPKFPVIPILLPRGEPPSGFLKLHTWVDLSQGSTPQMLEALVRAVRGKAPGRAAQEQIKDTLARICPYRKLRPFQEEDEPFFCGRQSFTKTLVDAVSARSFVAVVGASGSGKSSVVRAGLVPALRRQSTYRDQSKDVWDVVMMRPQRHPMHSLAAALMPLLEPEMSDSDRLVTAGKIAAGLNSGEVKLQLVVEQALKKQPGTTRLLMVVDQWEELYTVCEDAAGRQAFISQLLDSAPSSQLSVVMTLRGEFYGDALGDRNLSNRLQGAVVNIAQMTREELHSAIVEPARQVGLGFDEGLDQRILDEVGTDPGNLPLLEFLLAELWERRTDGRLTHEAYKEIGGVSQAMARRAESEFEKLSAAEQDALHWALLKMVVPGAKAVDTRQRVELNILNHEQRRVVSKLADERLLVTSHEGGREMVEVGHEALIKEWKRLKEWVDEDQELLQVLGRLKVETADWLEQEQNPDLLMKSRLKLAEAEKLKDTRPQTVDPDILAFIEASLSAEQERVTAASEREKREAQIALQFAEAEAARRAAELEVAREQANTQQQIADAARVRAADAQRWLYRTSAAALVATLLLVVATVTATFAYIWYNMADDEARVAEHSFGMALQTTGNVVEAVNAGLTSGGITANLARGLITLTEKTLSGLDQIRVRPETTRRQIELLLVFSDAFRALGDGTTKIERARQAKALAQAWSGDPKLRDGYLLKAGMRIADGLDSQQDLDGALSEFNAALKVAQRLSDSNPDDVAAAMQVATLRNKIGDVYQQMGLSGRALAEFREALRSMEHNRKKKPDDPNQILHHAIALERVGIGLYSRGANEQALDHHEEALKLRRRLVEAQKGNVTYQSNLALGHTNAGSTYRALGELELALKHHRDALKVRQDLADSDRSNALWQSILAGSLLSVGDLLIALKQVNDADALYLKSATIRRALVDKDPKNTSWRISLAYALSRVGNVHKNKGNPDAALAHYNEALKLLADHDNASAYQVQAAVFELRMRIVSMRQDRAAAAAIALKEARDLAQSFAKQYPGHSLWQSNLSRVEVAAGDSILDRDAGAALTSYRRALDIATGLLQRDPENFVRMMGVVEIHQSIADAYGRQGNVSLMRHHLEQAAEILQQLVAASRRNRDWGLRLASVLDRLKAMSPN